MKNMLKCPKCAGKRIWVIEKYRIPGESSEGRALPVIPHQEEPARSRLFQAFVLNPQGNFDLYLCDGCGYSELWANAVNGLIENKARGVRLVDTSDLAAGPFR